MRSWSQSKISSSCISVWCESGELERRRSSRFPSVTPVVETFSSDGITFTIPSNINDGAPLRKQPTALTRRLFPQKSLPQTSDRIPNVDLTGGAVNVGCEGGEGGSKRMEFIITGWCTKKWLRFDQTIVNLTSVDLGIPLVVI